MAGVIVGAILAIVIGYFGAVRNFEIDVQVKYFVVCFSILVGYIIYELEKTKKPKSGTGAGTVKSPICISYFGVCFLILAGYLTWRADVGIWFVIFWIICCFLAFFFLFSNLEYFNKVLVVALVVSLLVLLLGVGVLGEVAGETVGLVGAVVVVQLVGEAVGALIKTKPTIEFVFFWLFWIFVTCVIVGFIHILV